MFSQIGFFSLIITLFSSIAIIFSYKINNNLFFYKSIYINFISITISFFSLMGCYIISDFSNYNVFQNSHSTKPIFYKIVGTWGNHEGSMLLWILIMSFYNFIFSFNKSLSIKLKKITLLFQSFLLLGFTSFVIFTSNPFLINSIIVDEGLGLNPILQDPALAIHPPMLYLGYVGFSILLCLALAGLITSEINYLWISVAKSWSIYCLSMLTAGIALGSYWAYYELGWGGWWFWDPVENVSLMPWIAALALVHSLIITKEENLLKRWVIFLSILCFALSLMGTFLVRSGVLTSVHAFAADSSRGIFILLLFLVIVGFSLILFIIKTKEDKKTMNLLFLNKTSALLINNIIMIIACTTILIGTIYPIIIEVLTNKRISVGPPYYNSTVLPILLPGLLLMSVAPILSWKKNSLTETKFLIYSFIIISLFSALIVFFTDYNPWGFVGISIGIIILFGTIYSIFKKTSLIKHKNIKKLLLINSGLIAHLGVGILILGITFSSVFQVEYQAKVKLNQKISMGDYDLQLDNINVTNKDNYQKLTGDFSLYKNKKLITKIFPEKRYYNAPKMITTEAGISHHFLKDYYIILGEEYNNYWSIKFYENPLIVLIWLGAIIMFFSGLISMIKK